MNKSQVDLDPVEKAIVEFNQKANRAQYFVYLALLAALILIAMIVVYLLHQYGIEID